MLTAILGQNQTVSLLEKLAGYASGTKADAAPLLGVAGAGALGSLRKAADDQGLDAAGVMKLPSSQKGEVAAAIPADLARNLGGNGLLPAGIQSTAMSAEAAAERSDGGWIKWAGAAVVLALAVWILPQVFGGRPDVPSAIKTAVETDPLMLDGVNIGQSGEGVFETLTETLSGVTDTATEQSALTALTAADETLGSMDSAIGNLTAEGRSALSGLVGGAMPRLEQKVEGLLGNNEIAALLEPALDSIMARLNAIVT